MRGPTTQIILALLLSAAAAAGPRHILFAFVDHFEPRGPLPGPDVTAWVDDYITMASRHVDADGRHPIHSYFLISLPVIAPECLDRTLIKLNRVTYEGCGEVEFHGHHGIIDESLRTESEATNELLGLLAQARRRFNRHGAIITAEPVPRCTFGFIHGMWALDNSRVIPWPRSSPPGRQYCGVNRELQVLREQGAYADFTFPAWGTMEPVLSNAIFYAADDPLPASYKLPANTRFVAVGQPPWGDLMLVEGPSNNENIDDWDPPYLWRMDQWVASNVHVLGNNDWIFVKVHTHGLQRDATRPAVWESFFGGTPDRFYTDIEKSYNDGVTWKLHYVSAREMYNIIKAAEAGLTGDPGLYRDFLIPPYANMLIRTPTPYRLLAYHASEVTLELLEIPAAFHASFKEFSVGACILESPQEAGPWELSDARRNEGRFGELELSDETPSRYYMVLPAHGDLSIEKP